MSALDSELYWSIIKILRFIKRNFFIFLGIIATLIILVKFVSPSFKGKTIDHVRVEVLTPAELKALKKYPNAYHLKVGQSKGISSPIKSQKEFEKNPEDYISKYDLKKYEIPDITMYPFYRILYLI